MFGGGGLDGLDQALRLLGNFHRLEFFLRGRRGGGGRFVCVRVRGAGAFSATGCRRAFGRQAGGDVFRAFNFVQMTFLKQAVGTALFADHVRAGLDRLAVGLLVSGVQAAFGLEPHSAAAPREVIVAHS